MPQTAEQRSASARKAAATKAENKRRAERGQGPVTQAKKRPTRKRTATQAREHEQARRVFAQAYRGSQGGRTVTITDKTGSIEVKTRSDTPAARAARYPGVVGASARLHRVTTELGHLTNAAQGKGHFEGARFIPKLPPAQQRRYTELRKQERALGAEARAKYEGALKIEKKRAAAIKRAQPKPPPKPKKTGRGKPVRTPEQKARDELLAQRRRAWYDASRAHTDNPNGITLARLKAARARYDSLLENVSGQPSLRRRPGANVGRTRTYRNPNPHGLEGDLTEVPKGRHGRYTEKKVEG